MERKIVIFGSKKIENLCKHILEECEKRGFTIEEIEELGEGLPCVISESVRKQLSQTTYSVQ